MTATRFYFAGSGTPAFTPTPNAGWDVTGSQAVRPLWLLSELAGTSTGSQDASHAETSATVVNRLKRQHVSASQVAAAHTISGTVTAVIRCAESSAAADLKLQLIAYVTDATGATVRGVLYSGNASSSVNTTVGDNDQEMALTASPETRILSGTVTNVAAQVGDRIVVEIGYRACNTVTTSYSSTFYIDDRASSSDYAQTAGLNTVNRPWVEFSDDIFSSSTAWTGTAAKTITVGTTSAAKLGLRGSAAKALTVGTTSAGVRGKLGGATRTLTVGTASTGVRGKVATTTQPLTITATSTGTVTHAGTTGATKTITVATTSALRLGVAGAAAKTLSVAATSAGVRGKVATATRVLTVGTASTGVRGKVGGAVQSVTIGATSAARLGNTAAATAALSLAVTATGTVTGEAGSVTYWDGATTHPATVLGWWDGAATHPATALGWWDGTTVHPLA